MKLLVHVPMTLVCVGCSLSRNIVFIHLYVCISVFDITCCDMVLVCTYVRTEHVFMFNITCCHMVLVRTYVRTEHVFMFNITYCDMVLVRTYVRTEHVFIFDITCNMHGPCMYICTLEFDVTCCHMILVCTYVH